MKSQLATLDPNARLIANTIGAKPILVFGDLILDSYLEGAVTRISPEAPVPVLYNPVEEKFSMGGAANVAHNLITLNNSVRLVGCVGSSSINQKLNLSEIFLELVRATGISDGNVVELNRKTTYKQRILAGRQQLLRIDSEDTLPLSSEEEELVLKAFYNASEGIGAIIISDYAKGIFTKRIGEELGRYAKASSIPLLADVKFRNLENLSNISVLKANLKEAQEFTGISFSEDISEVGKMAECLSQRFASQVVITCGGLGMVIYDGSEALHLSDHAKEVFDVSGAGDTVIAGLAHGLVRGMSLKDSASFATVAAGVAVSHQGTVAVRLDEVEAQLNKMIFPKTWGHEEWIVNSEYCGKKLVLNKGHCCSLHHHKIKDETFYIASGKVGFQMNDDFFILSPGDSLLITPGTKHRFYGLENSEIFEFSTHHMEDDSYRDELSGTFDKAIFDKVPAYSSLR